MIHSRCQIVKAVFYAVCSHCGEAGPEELSTQDAHESVILLGWDYRAIYPEGQRLTVYTCRACLAKQPLFDNPPIYATPLDPDCEMKYIGEIR
jgi:hypothetical protein